MERCLNQHNSNCPISQQVHSNTVLVCLKNGVPLTSNDLNTLCSTIKKNITIIEADPICLDKSIICI